MKKNSPKKAPSARPRLENLEDRLTPSAYSALVTADLTTNVPNGSNTASSTYYRLGEPTGPTATSAVNAPANNGTYSGAGVTYGAAGAIAADAATDKAIALNGSTGYVTIPSSSPPQANDPFGVYPTNFGNQTGNYKASFEVWFKTSTAGVILGQTDGQTNGMPTTPGGAVPAGHVPAVYVGTDGKVHGSLFAHDNNAQVTSTGVVNDNKYHHLVDTVSTNGTSITETLYLDGVAVGAPLTGVDENSYNSFYSYFLGAGAYDASWPNAGPSNTAAWSFFNGSLDEAAIYPYALSASQVAGHFAAASSTAPTVTTPTATNVTPTSATLGGNVTGDGGNAVTTRGVALSTNPNPTLTNGATNLPAQTAGTGTFTVNATGLTNGTTYYYAAYATNGNGTTYSTPSSFVARPAPSLPFSDPFTRGPASDLGQDYTSGNGSYSVNATNQAVAGAAASIATVNAISAADVSVQADVVAAMGGYSAVVARQTPPNGSGLGSFYFAGLTDRGPGVGIVAEVYRANANGTFVQVGTAAPVAAGAHTIRFEAFGTSLKLFVDNVLKVFGNDTGITAAGAVGLLGSQGSTFDNLTAAAINPTPQALNYGPDTFNSAGGELSRNYTDRSGYFFNSAGGQAVAGAPSSVTTLNGVTATDVAVDADVVASMGGFSAVVARETPAASGVGLGSMYFASLTDRGSGTGIVAEIYRVSANGGFTQIGTAAPVTAGAHHLRFEAFGTSLKLFVDGQVKVFGNDAALTTGSVGLLGSQGSTFDNFAAAATPPAPQATPYADTFGTAGNELSRAYTDRLGYFTDSAAGQAVAGATSSLTTLNGVSSANVTLTADVVAALGGFSALAARYTPSSNGGGLGSMYFASLTDRGPGVGIVAEIYRVNADGSFAAVGTSAPVAAGAHTLKFVLAGSTLSLFVDNVLKVTGTDAALTTGSVGLLGSQGSTFDNFLVA